MGILRLRALASAESRLGASSSQFSAAASKLSLRHAVRSLNLLQQRSECKDTAASNTCEKPVGSNGETLTIVLGIVIPVTAAIIVLLYLHRRNMRREALEDAHDPNQGLDFGLDEPQGAGRRRKSLFGGGAEKGTHKGTQLSMDINLASPYLVPNGAQDSRESIHSLARTLQTEKDPYQQAARYNASDAGSMRSVNPESPFNDPAGEKGPSNKPKNLGPLKMPPRGGSMPRSPASAHTPYTPGTPHSQMEKGDPFASPTTTPKAVHQLPGAAEMHNSPLPVQPIVPEIGVVGPADDEFDPDAFEMPDLPTPVASRNGPEGPGQAHAPHNPHAHPDDHDGLGDLDIPTILAPGALPHELEHGPLYDQHGNQPQMRPARQQPEAHGRDDRGRAPRRPPPPPNGPLKPPGLRVPQQGGKRTSVGHRPLPPNEVMQSDDPETRANRIRSFYKEYFEESKEAAPPVPAMPHNAARKDAARKEAAPKQATSIADYYDDDDDNCLGDAAYYDAETNSFIMPYAQPVARRAMTPPPASRSRDGPAPGGPPRAGPRGPPGSVSGVSLPGGARPRAGSAHDLRPGSSASARWNRGPPQKKLPPPSPLNTLPTPSKLGDDSFAILGAIEFAPPTSIREHVAGRSQSPMGERRPYMPKVPAASPLVNAHEELPVLPSPHMLRKSTTFTALDFAPPKKFKEAENMSETGSIRSERSGISAAQLNAIRSGAGRVSRLPGDTVFTQSAMDNQLKPQWGMRN